MVRNLYHFNKHYFQMKTLKVILFCVIIFTLSCKSSYNLHKPTDYDKTIEKLASKRKLNENQCTLLATSYHQANENDHKRIMELKKDGQADMWIEINQRLINIEKRQDKVRNLSDEIKDKINFKELNLKNEINNSREKAELYICAKVNVLLREINEENLKEAQLLISQLSNINPQSKNIGELKLKSVILQSKQILFRVATPIELYLPQEFAKIILDFDNETIYGIPFDVVPDKNTEYDLMIRIMIDEKIVSPERVDAVTFVEEKDNLKAVVTDKTMSKHATLKGKIQVIDVENDEIIINTPYNVTSTFRHQYAEISGDKSACSERTLQLLESKVIDFPSNESLLKGAAKELNSVLKNHYQVK